MIENKKCIKCLMISGRALGDAIIAMGLINEISSRNVNVRWYVWCRPESLPIFESSVCVDKIFTSYFPMGFHGNIFKITILKKIMSCIFQIRRLKPEISVDLIGDIRESLLGLALGSQQHIAPVWPRGHVVNRLIVNPFPKYWKKKCLIPMELENIYEVRKLIRNLIESKIFISGPSACSARLTYTSNAKLASEETKDCSREIIGIHPGASQKSKLWPVDNWRSLLEKLTQSGYKLRLYGSSLDLDYLNKISSGILDKSFLFTLPVTDFLNDIKKLKLLVCLDSFSAHAAFSCGVPNVMLFGSNNPHIWVTPNSVPVWNDGGCKFYPCYNRPRCIGSNAEYICIRSVSVDMVLKAIDHAILKSGN